MWKELEGKLVWRPNIKQEKFLSIPSTIREAFYGGGAGSGKSEVLLMYGISNRWHENPNFKQLFMRRTFPELRNEIVPRARELFRPLGARFNKSDMCFTFPREDRMGGTGLSLDNDGAIIFLGHCEHEDDVHKYDSMEVNLFTPDELTSFTRDIYLYIGFTRVRTSDPTLPAILRPAGMPGNIGHTFVFNRFVKPWPDGGKLIRGRGGNTRIFIQATLADNPHLDPNYAKSLDALPEHERKAKKFGDWTSYEGQVFDEFRDRKDPTEPENALHVIPEFEIPSYWPRVVSIDWGFSALTSVGFGAISPNRRLYVYRHLSYQRTKIEDWALDLQKYIEEDKPEDIVICHSAGQHRGDPHTILEQVESALGRSVRLGEKDRIGGKLLLHEYLRWTPKKKAPNAGVYDSEFADWLLRNKGPESVVTYQNQFKAQEELIDDLPKLQIFDNEGNKLISEAIKACVYEKSGANGKNKEDVAEFQGDDPYDMLRMLLHAADRFFDKSSEAHKSFQAKERVLNLLNETGDMTAFYRNMRKLESDHGGLTSAIPRFNSGTYRARRDYHVIH
jgi:hypothetical protein